ncbi:MAG: fluoride efflux transporter CrcB [Deltaproteobacteria bacterium]|nr:fluoride efflux transporter CrcB [Deltaproteobacteria bacterium]
MARLTLLAVAGAAGTLSRYLVGGLVHRFLGSEFPYGTLAVNLAGCCAIGFLGTIAEEKFLLSSAMRTTLLIGFLGAFTTFSSFAYETWGLFKESEYLLAGVNVAASFAGCFVGLLLGVLLARTI